MSKKLSGARRNVRRREERKRVNSIVARAEYLRDLLAEFGLTLRGFDPGVAAYREHSGAVAWDGSNYQFGQAEWNWLQPLLEELRAMRWSR